MLNLHDIVRTSIVANHPDEMVWRYRSTGQMNLAGKIVPTYAEPVQLQAQIQSESDAALYHSNRADENSNTKAFYLYTSFNMEERVAGIIRPLGRNGDMFYRPSEGTWWLVVAVVEDFSDVGWSKVRCTLQVNKPAGVNDVPTA